MPAEAQPALKEMFNAARYRQIADLLAEAHPKFDRRKFLAFTTTDLAARSLLQRLRRTTEACRATLPDDYVAALGVLRSIAPRIEHNFIGIFLADFVGQYGHAYFDESMDALKYFTRFGSAEFAIREYLARDLQRTLTVMTRWALDPDEHVRRLACEGCRPRLPWSFHLNELIANPEPARPILEALQADFSLYVRKSVANHLNDITKDHPDWVLTITQSWDQAKPETKWIIKRALRTLIKQGDRRALKAIGAGGEARLKAVSIHLPKKRVKLGASLEFTVTLQSAHAREQQVVIDYIVHYRKKSGQLSPKVFKLKECTLAAGEIRSLTKRHRLQNFTTRVHYAGRHRVEISINGTIVTGADFMLLL